MLLNLIHYLDLYDTPDDVRPHLKLIIKCSIFTILRIVMNDQVLMYLKVGHSGKCPHYFGLVCNIIFKLHFHFNILLKCPSLFAALSFWTFQNKSHNIKALVILSQSWSPFFPLTYLYGEKELLWGPLCSFGVCSPHLQKNSFVIQYNVTWWTTNY